MDSLTSCFFSGANLLYKYVIGYILPSGPVKVAWGGGTEFERIKRLGEGGYAYVDLVRGEQQALYAMKTVLAQSPAILKAAEQEASIQAQLSHPALLPLLETHVVSGREGGSAADTCTRFSFLFPAYTDGTLAEELEALERRAAAHPGGARQGGPLATGTLLLSIVDTLSIFHQIASGLASMHEAGFAHRDMKPHNVLIQRLSQSSQSSPALPVSIAMQPPSSESSALLRGESAALEHTGKSWQEPRQLRIKGAYRAVIMDFGSSCQRHLHIPDRPAAMNLQEDAESNCTATFRAPELMSPPSGTTLDLGAADVWSLGCTLFAMCYGRSPFQVALDRGGSLALAITNATLPFPTLPPASPLGGGLHQGGGLLPMPELPAASASLPGTAQPHMPSPNGGQLVPGHLALQALVKRMCATDPKARPTASALAETALQMLESYAPP